MEEDIKILEQFREFLIIIRIPSCNFEKEIQAIENLIKGYRELEGKNKALEQGINPSYEETISELEKQLFDSIPKLKIREKIEEYKQEMKEIRAKKEGLIWNYRLHKLDYAIEVLKELMEDK